jgi:hypothetical protein
MAEEVQVHFDVPAPVAVCGLLVIAALTKGGHSTWAIGGLILVFASYLTTQYSQKALPLLVRARELARKPPTFMSAAVARQP